MKQKLIAIIAVMVIFNLLLVPTVTAESAFGSSSSSSESAFASDSFGNTASNKLEWGGSLELDTRAILDKNGESDIASTPILDLDLNYKRDNSELEATLNFDDSQADEVKIEEAFMRLYYDKFDLVAGRKKEVWGKGDKLHVVDNLNGEDLTDFVNPEYLERQIGEEMAKVNYYLGSGTLEAVYTPNFTPNKLAAEGNWVTNQMELFNQAGAVLKNSGSAANIVLASELKNRLTSVNNEIEDGQLALRYTNSKSGYDYGFSIYQGKMREPSMDLSSVALIKEGVKADNPQKIKAGVDQGINLHYDDVTVLGAEFSSVLAGINSRAELAYYLTDDTAGDDREVHNNKVAWLIGGDRDLPLHNLNLNLQVKSEYILDNDQVEGNALDVDYNQEDEYFTNLVSLELSDEFKNQTILPSTTLVYNVETNDYSLDNELEFKLKDDTSLKFNYKIFEGDNWTDFGQFDKNDYFSVNFEYDF